MANGSKSFFIYLKQGQWRSCLYYICSINEALDAAPCLEQSFSLRQHGALPIQKTGIISLNHN